MLTGHNWGELQTWIWIHITWHSQMNCWTLTWISAMTHIVHCSTVLHIWHVSYCWVLYVKVVVTQVFKKLFESYEMWVFLTNLTRAHHFSACHYPQISLDINMDKFDTLFRLFSLVAELIITGHFNIIDFFVLAAVGTARISKHPSTVTCAVSKLWFIWWNDSPW